MFIKRSLSKIALAVALVVSTPIMTSCVSSTTNSSTTDRSQMMLVSEAEVNAQAKQSYDQVISEAKSKKLLNKDAKVTKRVKTIANNLIAKAPQFRADCKDWPWEVNVITSEEVNAWCMPGGRIAGYTGLINTLKPNDDELAMVIGHEISHALREHSREQMSTEMLRTNALSLASLFGVSDTAIAIGDKVSTVGFSLPFSRSHETEADVLGVELMMAAGYDPEKGVTLWNKMLALKGKTSLIDNLLSTHPADEDRIANINEVTAKLKAEKAAKK